MQMVMMTTMGLINRKVGNLVATAAAAFGTASPSLAIDAGCYSADTVRQATWLADGPEKQATIITGENVVTNNPVYATISSDGDVGYLMEKENDRICIMAKFKQARTNLNANRPRWANIPAGSRTDISLLQQEQKPLSQTRIVFGATTVVKDGDRELDGPQILFVTGSHPVNGLLSGSFITNHNGDGSPLAALQRDKPLTNANFYAFARLKGQ